MGRKVFEIVNETYKNLYDFQQLTEKQIDEYVNTYIKKADLNLVTGVVDGNAGNKLVAFGVSFPSFTDALREIGDGKLFPYGLAEGAEGSEVAQDGYGRFAFDWCSSGISQRREPTRLFCRSDRAVSPLYFKWAEAMPQMETNTGVQSQWQYLESEQHRRHRCYKKKI